MKKLILIVVLILFSLGLYFWSSYFIPDESKEEKIEVDVLLSTSPRDLAIEKYLESQKYFAWTTRKNSQNACVFENLGKEEDLFPLSLWVFCQEYILEQGEIKELSGSSGPVLLDYPNELSFFDLDRFSFRVPGDGSLYNEDIKKIFSAEIQDKIFNYQGQKKLDTLLKKKILLSKY